MSPAATATEGGAFTDRPSTSSRFPSSDFDMTDAGLTEHYVSIYVGQSTIAWNSLCHGFYDIFQCLSHLPEETAKFVFFSVQSDRAQRNMVQELVKHELKNTPEEKSLARDIQTLLGEANKIAGRRNDILHIVFLDPADPFRVTTFVATGHLKGKAGRALVDAIANFVDDCLHLTIKIQQVAPRILRLPSYRAKLLAAALAAKIPDQLEEILANWEVFDQPARLQNMLLNPKSSEA